MAGSSFPSIGQVASTPLVAIALEYDEPPIWCKLEYLQPSGSTKDRIAAFILSNAWQRGEIGPGSRVVEASSGSTSIALALACARAGLKFSAVMPEGVSRERVLTIRAYGGDVVPTPDDEGILGALARAEKLARDSRAFYARQFENPDNPAAHRIGTAHEIVRAIPDARVDAVVSGVGTGGTIVGLYEGLRERGCDLVPCVARPIAAAGTRASQALAGTGCFTEAECSSFSARIPGVVDKASRIFDASRLSGLMRVEVDDEEALATARALIRRGFPVGPSSGLNYAAARAVRRKLGSSAAIVTVFPDRMERYFSTALFEGLR